MYGGSAYRNAESDPVRRGGASGRLSAVQHSGPPKGASDARSSGAESPELAVSRGAYRPLFRAPTDPKRVDAIRTTRNRG